MDGKSTGRLMDLILEELSKMPYFAHMRKAALFVAALLVTTSIVAFHGARTAPETAKKHPAFLMISDIHVDTKSKSTKYGGDTGMDLWHAFLRKMDDILGGPDTPGFIVYTGDLPAHYK